MKRYATVLLVTTDGEIPLQQRENKPNIINPGKITFFGGQIHPHEEPIDAAIREVYEELTIKLSKGQIKILGVYYKKAEMDGEDAECNIFIAKNITKTDLTLQEGESIYFLKTVNELNNEKLSRITKIALKDYFERKR